MKVLTLHQPWASLIALGVKTIETRGHSTNVRGRIAIHAAARPPDALYVGDYTVGYLDPKPATRRMWNTVEFGAVIDLPLGAIVATANLIDCIPMVEWGEDPTHSHLTIGNDGHLRLWRYAPEGARRAWQAYDPATRASNGGTNIDDRTDQLPYGDFAPGRFAWLLEDIEPLEVPVPFRGGQGWSRSWSPTDG